MKRTSPAPLEVILPLLYFIGRIFLFIGMVPDAFTWAGDLPTYFQLAHLPGWPFIQHWIEYPPIFPFLCELFHIASGGSEFIFSFILTFFLAGAGAGGIYLFHQIAAQIFPPDDARLRTLLYFGLTAALPYTWWYFEPLVILFILAANLALLHQKDRQAGLWIGLGILTKWFPVFLLPALWRRSHWKRALRVSLIALGLTVLVFSLLYLASPEMTKASLIVQPGRSSWQTLWALIDGNLVLGNIFEFKARLDPTLASTRTGFPPIIPTWATLILFGGLGLFFLLKSRPQLGFQNFLAVQGFTWVIFLTWANGWSPQWILYLLPLILLTLPVKTGLLLSTGLTLLTLIEWPLLLARHIFTALWFIVPLRLLLFALLAWNWFKISRSTSPRQPTAG